MAGYDRRSGIQIGEVLKATRTRLGLDIRTVEERTKIRTKYLRALENEDWDVLPSAAYAKGFLRTYARALGLDGDALVDELRRQVESPDEPAYPVSEHVLEHRRRPGEPRGGPRIGAILGIGGALVVVILLILGLTGGGDDERGDRAERRQARQERQEERRQRERRRERRQEARAEAGPLTLRIVLEQDVHICLVGDDDQPLIDGQVVAAGTEDSFEASRFLLQFPSGYDPDQLQLVLGGEPAELPDVSGPAAFRIVPPGDLREAPAPGPECP